MSRSSKLTLIALIVVCTLPVVASYLAFYVWKPQDRVNYGELIAPTLLPEGALRVPEGRPPVSRATIEGTWALVYAGPGACGEECATAIYAMRQTRVAQRRDMERVSRLWLLTDQTAPAADLLAAHGDMHLAHADPQWLAAMPGAEQGVHFYLVDPLGHVMMRFPEQADIKRVIKDLQRLLKYSALGR
jgi:cytochrome oxidase Cu insertion factor (SCO1/SenC/PrrC family)